MGSTPAPSGTQAGGPAAGDVTYLVANLSSVADAWLGYGMTSGAANANAVVPLIGTNSAALPVPRGTVQSFTLSPLLFFSAITASGQAAISITPGEGV